MGFVVRERSIGLTPRGKLRARPCSGPSALRYEPHPASSKQPSKPDSFTAPLGVWPKYAHYFGFTRQPARTALHAQLFELPKSVELQQFLLTEI